MPIDNGTIIGTTNADQLTELLSDDNRDFFITTYSFYLVALVLAGKSIFYGSGRFANITFKGREDYVFPASLSQKASKEEKNNYKKNVNDKIDKIKNYHKDSDKSGNFHDIVNTLTLAACRAVFSFLDDMKLDDKRKQFIENRRAEAVTIRQTLQIKFWNEITKCVKEKYFTFQKKGNNLFSFFIPFTSSNQDINELLNNTDKGLAESDTKRYSRKNFREEDEEKEKEQRERDKEQIEKERVLYDSWDIRRYRIFLVKQVGDTLSYRIKNLSPMKCYALYYELCDRTPFLNMIQDQEERKRYEETKKWSDQMIADLFKQDLSIPEEDRNRISRENIKNYRNGYANELIKWLSNAAPGLPDYSARDLVTANNIRFENMAPFFFHTHVKDKASLNKIDLHKIYQKFINAEKTLKS